MTQSEMEKRIKELEEQLAAKEAQLVSQIRVTTSKEGNMICISGLRAYPWSFYPSEAQRVFTPTVIDAVQKLAAEMIPNEVKRSRETQTARSNGRIYSR